MIAKYGGQCILCHREIHIGDDIRWALGEGAAHTPCAQGEDPPADRRIGSAANAGSTAPDLPHHPEAGEEGPGVPAGGWEAFTPRGG